MRRCARSISASTPMPDLLELANVTAGYDRTVIVEDVSVSLKQGGALAVLGRNGVGKSTLLRTIVGHTTLHGGRIQLAGADIGGIAPWRRARLGIGYVPQEREIFPSLSVLENLTVAFRLKPEATTRKPEATGVKSETTPGNGGFRLQPEVWTLERIFDLFPSLAARQRNYGNQLSGGEQQMLSVARALALQPTVILLDEPFEGLAPTIVDKLVGVFQQLRDTGLSIVLAEQHARLALGMTDEAIALVRGRIVLRGASQRLIDDPASLEDALTVRQGSSLENTHA
jgi:branched-chain amino acid transport system ATP-binding protein